MVLLKVFLFGERPISFFLLYGILGKKLTSQCEKLIRIGWKITTYPASQKTI